MKIGPRYKIARRLGADIFEKTKTQKFALSSSVLAKRKRPMSRSDFATQLREKQRARFFYGIGERQFARYVANAVGNKNVRDDEGLFRALETRLDNVIYRLGIAPSRQASRQLVSHGHFTVNGIRITIPSYSVKVGDSFKIRQGSTSKTPFQNLADRIRDHIAPHWVKFDLVKGEITVVSTPKLVKNELPFNIAAILEFYRR